MNRKCEVNKVNLGKKTSIVGKWYDLEEEWNSFDEIVSDFYSVMAELIQRDGKCREEWEIHDLQMLECGYEV